MNKLELERRVRELELEKTRLLADAGVRALELEDQRVERMCGLAVSLIHAGNSMEDAATLAHAGYNLLETLAAGDDQEGPNQ